MAMDTGVDRRRSEQETSHHARATFERTNASRSTATVAPPPGGGVMTMEAGAARATATVSADVARCLAQIALDQDVDAVTDLRRLTGGASRETWSFDAWHRQHRAARLILQVERASAVNGGGTMALEASVQRAARTAGVPVPAVLLSGEHESIDRPFLLMERLDGVTIAHRVQRLPEFAEARTRFASQCGELLGRIHGIDWSVFPDIETADPVTHYASLLSGLPDAYPTLELALRWLYRYRPGPGGSVLLHGDFRLGNLLFNRTGIGGVLDWELCHVGDPAEDIAWLSMRSWRFGLSLPVGGLGRRAELYCAYEAATGRSVDPDQVHWWEVFGNVKWAVICALQAQAHRDGHVRSIELLSLGRRVALVERELMVLLR